MSELDPETYEAPRQRRSARTRGRARRVARRLFGVGVFLVGVAAVFVVVALSLHLKLPFGINATHTTSSHTPPDGSTGRKGTHHSHSPGLTVNVANVALLLQPASRVAGVPFGAGGALFLGGYDAAGTPTNTLQTLAGASVQASGTLPGGDASAVAAAISGSVYLFGGIGSTIYQVTPTATNAVASLPAATADAAIATVGGTAYIIGGYTGASELNTIVAFTPPSTVAIVATLPKPLRYPAATAAGGEVFIAGGDSGGTDSSTVYRFDPQTKAVTTFATLPHAREAEAAGTLAGRIIVIGGRNSATGLRTRAIYVINAHSGSVHLGGLLPVQLSDMTAVQAPGQILVAGGVGGSGQATASIYGITVRHL